MTDRSLTTPCISNCGLLLGVHVVARPIRMKRSWPSAVSVSLRAVAKTYEWLGDRNVQPIRTQSWSDQSQLLSVLPDSYQVTVAAWVSWGRLPLVESAENSAPDWLNKHTPLLGSCTNRSEAEVSCLVSRQDLFAEMFWRESKKEGGGMRVKWSMWCVCVCFALPLVGSFWCNMQLWGRRLLGLLWFYFFNGSLLWNKNQWCSCCHGGSASICFASLSSLYFPIHSYRRNRVTLSLFQSSSTSQWFVCTSSSSETTPTF